MPTRFVLVIAVAFFAVTGWPAESGAAAAKQCIRQICKFQKKSCAAAFRDQFGTSKVACREFTGKERRQCKKTAKGTFRKGRKRCKAAVRECKKCCKVGQSTACSVAVCGDGMRVAGEECDGPEDSACPGQCRADCTCGNGDACCPWCTGPAGGVIEVTDPDSAAYGVRVEVPPGTWQDCRAFGILAPAQHSTRFMPAGYYPYRGRRLEPVFEIDVGGEHDSPLYMEISLPIQDMSLEPGQIPSAFYYDDNAERWRIIVPNEIDSSVMVIRSQLSARLWSWGKASLFEIDVTEELDPVVQELFGNDAWNQLATDLEDLYHSAIPDAFSPTCANVMAQLQFFDDLFADTAARVEASRKSLEERCGYCDITTLEFFDEYVEHVKLTIHEWFINEVVREGILTQIAGIGFLFKATRFTADRSGLICPLDNYECFLSTSDHEAHAAFAFYYVSYVMTRLDALYLGYVCSNQTLAARTAGVRAELGGGQCAAEHEAARMVGR